jgi:predicted hotdog family 3-hydroxylacyl-ACP dehydratase
VNTLAPPHWSELIPHAGTMRLIDHVVDWDDNVLHAIAERHSPHDHPLCNGLQLHAVHLAEYGAQAAAVHGALLAVARGNAKMRPGRLVSLRDMQLTVEYVLLSRGRFDIRAECLFADVSGGQYAFQIDQGGQRLASGRIAVIHLES